MLKKLSITLAILLFFQLHASDHAEKSFFAISSLKYYLDNELQKIDGDEIQFSEKDLAYLWKKAAYYPSVQDLVGQAQETVLLAARLDKEQAYAYLLTASLLLEEAWIVLKKELLEEVTCQEIEPHFAVSYPYFDENPYLDNKIKNKLRPYLIPLEHPKKKDLDAIFLPARASQDETNFHRSGFSILHSQHASYIKVASHPFLDGYLLKVYLDSELRKKDGKPGWYWLLQRCRGAENIRKVIKKKNIQHYVVPGKWLYPLPAEPSPPASANYNRQPVVLLVEKINIASSSETKNAWLHKITHKHLDELYTILSYGCGSTYLPGNVPYCHNGKFAFVDTEYPHRKLHYNRVKPYLTSKMKEYWDKLVKKGGKG